MTLARKRLLFVVVGVLVAALVAFLVWKRLAKDDTAPPRPAQVTIATAVARSVPLTRTVEGVADVLAAEAVTITAENGARIAEIGFTEGAEVARGAVLVRLDAAQERADLATREAEAAEGRGRLARLQRLVAEGAVARGEVADLARTVQAADARIASQRTLVDDTVIRAPFAGTVGLRQVSVGAFVQPGTELVTLDRLDRVKLRFNLPEAAIGRVRVGSAVTVRSPAFPDRVFTGRIAAFAGRLDPGLRTLTAEAQLPNPGRLLRPGMLGNVTVDSATVNAVVIPPVALQVRGPTHFVYRIVEGCAVRAEVEIGERKPGGVEVLKGLQAGAVIATEGFDNLSSGTPVRDKRDAAKGPRPPPGQSGGKDGKPAPPSDEQKARDAQLKARCQQVAAAATRSARGR